MYIKIFTSEYTKHVYQLLNMFRKFEKTMHYPVNSAIQAKFSFPIRFYVLMWHMTLAEKLNRQFLSGKGKLSILPIYYRVKEA